ncbi:MAG TPA: hypothetical protein VFX30_03750 [bacterium]|nr:hypothetical protein [bacterium]
MIRITNFGSGELLIEDGSGLSARLDRDTANRLIMAGRMQTVAEFMEKLHILIPNAALVGLVRAAFDGAASSTEKWNLKEKFARLTSLAKGYQSKNPSEVVETVSF